MINLPGQTESLLFVSVDPNLSQWIVSVVKHRAAVTGHAAIKYTLVWYETAFCFQVLDNVCSDGFVLTAPLGTQMAWTEPSDWLRADLRNSISVDKKTSLRSISWKDRQIRRKAGSDRDAWFNTAGPTNKKSISCLEQQWFFSTKTRQFVWINTAQIHQDWLVNSSDAIKRQLHNYGTP